MIDINKRRTSYLSKCMKVRSKITCGICGKVLETQWHQFFGCHVCRFHKMGINEYILKYCHSDFQFDTCGWCGKPAVPNRKIENNRPILYYDGAYLCDDMTCVQERKKHNRRSYVYAEKTYKLSPEDAKKFVRAGSPFHRDYFDNDEDYASFQDQTSEQSFIKKYGKEKGKKRFQECVDKWKGTCGSEQAFVHRFGEKDGKERWKKCCKDKAITREAMRKKHGKEEGDRRYELFLSKTLKNFVSRESCEWLMYVSVLSGYYIKHGKNSSGEKKIRCPNKIIPVDGYCQELDVVLEFFGDVWHCNPRSYSGLDINPRGMTAFQVWSNDHKRLCDLSTACRAVIVCWEYDWLNNPVKVLDCCVDYLQRIAQKTLPRGVYYA